MDRSFSERLRLNSAIVKNRYWVLPVDDVGHENYMPVGRGVKSSEVCGRWVGLSVCKNVEGHKGKFLGVTDCANKVVVRHRHVLVWSPHYHVLGYVEGGYARCRECLRKWDCLNGCGGFDDRRWRGYKKHGYYVRVFDERQTVFGTAHYQLNHATLRLGVKRFHVVTWFGCCGNRKFKSADVDVENVCPVCESEMVRSVYVGKRHIVKDVGHPDYVPLFVGDEFDENGEPNYIDVDGG